ncbi:TPA: hypothetical protein O7U53_004828 [Salmonella enterica]|nr:hypothetical protein [Salmonella enterica]
MGTELFPEQEVRHRANALLSNFPYKKMQEWVVSQKNHGTLREMKKEMTDFYLLTNDLSEQGIAERQLRWSELQKKYPAEIIGFLLLLGARGRQLYYKAMKGDRYAVMVFLSVTEAALDEI